MSEKIKKNWYKYILLLGYLVVLLPFVYSVFYSMPANDDFAWAIEWFSNNRLIEVIERIKWSYMNCFGQSGVIAMSVQVLFNPLYWFKNEGHSFGIVICLIFVLLYVGYIVAIKRLAKYLFHLSTKEASFFSFICILIIFTAYYYADVYNWWSGIPGYSLLMFIMILFCGEVAKYHINGTKKEYIVMVVLGIVVCTGMMDCVAAGAFYVVVTFIVNGKNGDSIIKKIIPLVAYICSGVITVAAPGNYRRTSVNEGSPDYVKALYVAFYDLIERMLQTVIHKPWVVALFVLLFVLGMKTKPYKKHNLGTIVFSALAVIASAFGAIYPYIAGERKEIGRELASRIHFVEDYIIFIGFSLVIFAFGQWFCEVIVEQMVSKIIVVFEALSVIFLGIAFIRGTITTIVPYDIVKRSQTIKEVYYIWDDILNEIEQSPDERVVIERYNIPWCPYSYVVSLDEGTNTAFDWAAGYYGTCNYCAAIWYDKESIAVYIYND